MSRRHTLPTGRERVARSSRRPNVNEPATEGQPDALKYLSADERRSSIKPRVKPGIRPAERRRATSEGNYPEVRACRGKEQKEGTGEGKPHKRLSLSRPDGPRSNGGSR